MGAVTARRRVQYVLVCEDEQHEAFARRFLKRMKVVKDPHQLRVERPSWGSADRFVRETYVKELVAHRRAHAARGLVVLIDGDRLGVGGRLRELDDACARAGVPARTPQDLVAIFVPTWNIETWLEYLEGRDVDEGLKDYPKLTRARQCNAQVARLAEMCARRSLRPPAPDSLRAACSEYDARLR